MPLIWFEKVNQVVGRGDGMVKAVGMECGDDRVVGSRDGGGSKERCILQVSAVTRTHVSSLEGGLDRALIALVLA